MRYLSVFEDAEAENLFLILLRSESTAFFQKFEHIIYIRNLRCNG